MMKEKSGESWYSKEGNLREIDKANPKIKLAPTITFDDGILRKELQFLKKYSSVQIQEMIRQTSRCTLRLNYPIRFFNGKEYQTFPFNNYSFPIKIVYRDSN